MCLGFPTLKGGGVYLPDRASTQCTEKPEQGPPPSKCLASASWNAVAVRRLTPSLGPGSVLHRCVFTLGTYSTPTKGVWHGFALRHPGGWNGGFMLEGSMGPGYRTPPRH